MKKILKFLFAFLAPVWLAFSCAHAEESDVPLSISDFEYYLTGTWQYNQQSGNFSGYDMVTRSDGYRAQNRIGTLDSNHSQYNNAFLVMNTSQAWKMPLTSTQFEGGNYSVPSLSVNTCDFVISYDLPALDGWYTLQYDIFIGVTCNYNSYTSAVLTNTFTSDGSADFYTDSNGHTFIVQYLDHDLTVSTTYSTGCTSDMLHFRVIYEGSQNDSTLEFHLGDYIYNHIAGWRAGGLNGGRYNTEAWYMIQSFFLPTLTYESEPPATPTPTPTPSPNQDIINNDNTNTTNIISSINDGFDALSAVFEGAIYGLTDLFFGSASDWIDFFSDVQDDMEEYLPVVSFFQSCKNILANFFNVESTDPTALQFVAGWQSDIYTLHIGALPLVLPEGTYNFFPEVNFNLNNPFMNEIRPYWLTFSNVLITLLFLRYLANYLFRWTQLLTGDTSVAFQLFHHAPDELENLGTDPYDLAGDYSYDSIDSANHDLYQDAEAHYGHGAARYLSKVFHSK